MANFPSYDGTRLAYNVRGDGEPLVCVPGGPGRAAAYLEDLGGLDRHRTLVLLDNRGTGASEVPADPVTYRCDRLVDDVDALRAHLDLDRFDLLAHSAAGNIALRYAARFPARLARLVLVTPGTMAVGLDPDEDEERAALTSREGEPWYADAVAAVARLEAGENTAELRQRVQPFMYGRWDERAQAHAVAGVEQRSAAAAAGFTAPGAFDPDATRAGLREVTAPVLVYAGARDLGPTPANAERLAALFPRAEVCVQPDAGHYPWLDDAERFATAVAQFLTANRP